MRIFAYGTLIIPKVMRVVTGRDFIAQETLSRDYARFRVKNAHYPGIVQARGAVTDGMIYFDVDGPALKRLARFEGDLYRRTRVCVETLSGESINANTYVVKSGYFHRLTSTPWCQEEFERTYLGEFSTSYPGFRAVRS